MKKTQRKKIIKLKRVVSALDHLIGGRPIEEVGDEVTKKWLSELPTEPFTDTEMLHKESDRGCILVSAAMLDERLGYLLKAVFLDSTVADELLGAGSGTAPLGTFSARIKIAYSLGIISPAEFHDLKIIRSIRNDAAHFEKKRGDGFATGFNNKSTKTRCSQFKILPSWFVQADVPSRLIFMLTTNYISGHLKGLQEGALLIRKVEEKDALRLVGVNTYNKKVDSIDLCVSLLKAFNKQEAIPRVVLEEIEAKRKNKK